MNYAYKNRDCFFILLLIPVVVFGLGILLISIELLFKSVINNLNLNDFAICVGVFAFSSPILLIVGCNLYHIPWLSGNVTYGDFKKADQIMRIVRFMTYVICANNLVLVYAKEECTQNTLLMVMFTISSFALFESVLQSTWQTTFRRRSNYAIAIANTLLYLAMLDLSCNSNTPLLGWISWEKDTNIRDQLSIVVERIPDTVKNGVIITLAITMFKDSLSSLFASMNSRHPSNLTQQRRRNRRRLLTHWEYKRDAAVSSHEDLSVRVLLAEGIAVGVTLVFALFRSSFISGDSNNPSFVFATYLIILAAMILAPAIMSIWNISDETLIQSEYTYLTIKSIHLSASDIRESHSHWRDFCQVLVNLSSNVSGLESEDEGFHDVSNIMNQTHQQMGSCDECAHTKFLSDILRTKGDINAALLRESGHEGDSEKSARTKADTLQQAKDIQFASMFVGLLNQHYNNTKTKQTSNGHLTELNPLFFVEHLIQVFFDGHNQKWAQRINMYNLNAHDGIQLVKLDVLIRILQKEGSLGCGISWLGCTCTDRPSSCPGTTTGTNNVPPECVDKRLELILLFPFLVINCYRVRWSNQSNSIFFHDEIWQYYQNIAKEGISAGDADQLKDVIYSAYRHLLEMDADFSILPEVANKFDDKLKIRSASTDPYLSQIAKGNKAAKNYDLSIDGRYKYLERFLDTQSVSQPKGVSASTSIYNNKSLEARDALKKIAYILFTI